MEGRVHSLETFGLVDGPGVRFVVFMQGCAMRCQYCHNPETWSGDSAEVQRFEPKALFERIYRDRRYWGRDGKNGGITVSGGEPLLQMPFVEELFTIAHAHHVHTALDTAGQPYREDSAFQTDFERLMSVTDLVLLDLKVMDASVHKTLTGHDNANILAMARRLGKMGKPIWIRHVLVPGLTDDEDDLREMAAFIRSLGSVTRVEVLPYHTLGLAKWVKLGISYPLDGVRMPTEEEVHRAEELLCVKDYSA